MGRHVSVSHVSGTRERRYRSEVVVKNVNRNNASFFQAERGERAAASLGEGKIINEFQLADNYNLRVTLKEFSVAAEEGAGLARCW